MKNKKKHEKWGRRNAKQGQRIISYKKPTKKKLVGFLYR